MNPNSALLWLPRIEAAGLPVPRTITVPYDHARAIAAISGEPVDDAACQAEIAAMQAACEQIGYPCFIRTDLSSAKHDGPRAYFVESPLVVGKRMSRTIEDSEMKHWTGIPSQAILVREFLHLDALFVAFGGLPIAREWRLFACPRGVTCWHFYWPEKAIDFWSDEEPYGWEAKLRALAEPPLAAERGAIEEQSIKAATACADTGTEYWSLDWARDVNGKWWLIDMARAQDSWHPEDCPMVGGGRAA